MSSAEQAKTNAAAQTLEAGNLLDLAIAATRVKTDNEKQRVKTAFQVFLEQLVKPGQVISRDVETSIKTWIAEIDKKLSTQLNEVLHHADFQQLEGTWRGLNYLVQQSETGETMKIRVLNASKRDLLKDLENAS